MRARADKAEQNPARHDCNGCPHPTFILGAGIFYCRKETIAYDTEPGRRHLNHYMRIRALAARIFTLAAYTDATVLTFYSTEKEIA